MRIIMYHMIDEGGNADIGIYQSSERVVSEDSAINHPEVIYFFLDVVV